MVGSSSVSPTNLIEYNVTWLLDPIAGDIITWRYDSTGTYDDEDGESLAAQEFDLTNCLADEILSGFAGQTA